MKKLVFQTCILVKGVLISSQRRSGVQRPQRLKTDPLWRHRITREITSSKPSLPSLSQEVGVDTSVLCNILVLITSAIVSHQILVLYTIAPNIIICQCCCLPNSDNYNHRHISRSRLFIRMHWMIWLVHQLYLPMKFK